MKLVAVAAFLLLYNVKLVAVGGFLGALMNSADGADVVVDDDDDECHCQHFNSI